MSEIKLDSLGRRNHGWKNVSPGRPSSGFNEYVMVRMDKNMKNELLAKGKNMSALIRDYIEWGLENDEN